MHKGFKQCIYEDIFTETVLNLIFNEIHSVNNLNNVLKEVLYNVPYEKNMH